jgi:hypothetical protein
MRDWLIVLSVLSLVGCQNSDSIIADGATKRGNGSSTSVVARGETPRSVPKSVTAKPIPDPCSDERNPAFGPDTCGDQDASVSAYLGTWKITRVHVAAEHESRVTGKKDVVLSGKTACKIDFVYDGFDPEDLFWDNEACDAVSAEMVDRVWLEKNGKWEKLDSFAQKQIAEMPNGKVRYVEGAFAASLYPIGTTQQSYEISVAD